MFPELLGRWLPWVWPTLQAFRQSDSFYLLLRLLTLLHPSLTEAQSSQLLLGMTHLHSLRRGVCLFFLLIQARPLLLLLSQKPSSLHILIHPGLPRQPPTHTCKSHSRGIGFITTGQKHSPKWSRRRQDRGGHGFGGAQAPPPSSSFLPALQMDFREGTSVCFPGVNAFRVGGCYSPLLYVIHLSSW